jgi:RNase P subunit RPR2
MIYMLSSNTLMNRKTICTIAFKGSLLSLYQRIKRTYCQGCLKFGDHFFH